MWLADARRQAPPGSGTLEEVMVRAAVPAWAAEARKAAHVPGAWLVLVPREADLQGPPSLSAASVVFVPEASACEELRAFLASGAQPYDPQRELVLLGCCQDTGLRARVNVPLAPALMFGSAEEMSAALEGHDS